ncbi:MAG TPA: hypothetical protein VH186_25820 [Chloroflexia bacterium]|nr:hypothetical protein [Chloroflexia bacterium]
MNIKSPRAGFTQPLIWLGLAAFSVLFYLVVALQKTPTGFPLDDAWIHQVFARNLALHGQFAYNLGQPVAGSTSPLWTFMLIPGYAFDNFYGAWAYALGILFLALTGREAFLLAKLLSGHQGVAWGAALGCLFEWRLVWAGASGMETIVFAFGTLFLARSYIQHFPIGSEKFGQHFQPRSTGSANRLSFLLGVSGGLLTLVRPEGMALLGLVALDMAWRMRQTRTEGWMRTVIKAWLVIAAGWALLVIPYFIFNYLLSGSPLPNTFSAKVSAYADLSPQSLATYFGGAFYQLFLAGALFALVPGLLYCISSLQRGLQDWRPLVWLALVLVLYALRLPVTYHHARYLMPLIPFLVVYGVIGTAGLMNWLRSKRLPVVARSLPWLIGLIVLYSWFTGSLAYQFDVKFINDEQVRIGHWLAANTAPEAVVATHDIGAIGYFSQRKIVDTAGLVSPEFVKIVTDHQAILNKLNKLRVNYFAMLPSWYPDLYEQLEKQGIKVFQPQETYLEQFGEKNMVVYKLR